MNSALTPAMFLRNIVLSIAATALVFLLCLYTGPGRPGTKAISFGRPPTEFVRERALRVGSAAAVGAALAASGVLLQALLKNPLADPYILGVSSGASVGVMAWIVFGAAFVRWVHRTHQVWARVVVAHGMVLPAIVGALGACAAVFALARPRRGAVAEPLTLLLAGVVLNSFNGAAIMLLNSLLPPDKQTDIMNYLFGSIREEPSFTTFFIAVGLMVGTWAVAVFYAGALNIASLSDAEAATMGVSLGALRTLCFVAASVMTAATLALAGPIGFIGLMCPHICRMIFGPDHRLLLITAPLFGAIFLMLADTFVRSTGAWFHGDLPVGVVTALVGGPFFLLLLHRRPAWR